MQVQHKFAIFWSNKTCMVNWFCILAIDLAIKFKEMIINRSCMSMCTCSSTTKFDLFTSLQQRRQPQGPRLLLHLPSLCVYISPSSCSVHSTVNFTFSPLHISIYFLHQAHLSATIPSHWIRVNVHLLECDHHATTRLVLQAVAYRNGRH